MKLLLADDEHLVRYTLRDILEELPIPLAISEVETGTELVEAVERSRPDIAIVDIRMPGMSGLAAIEALNPVSPLTKWIILSGYSDFEYSRKALRLGVVDYLLKPVDPVELKEIITRVLDLIADETEGKPLSVGFEEGGQNQRDMPELLVRHTEIVARRRFREPIGVAQIAAELQVTPNYLSAVFKKIKGVSLTAFLTEMRMQEALQLLKTPGISVREVSESLGYSSSRHFSRLFKEKYGISPSDYQCS